MYLKSKKPARQCIFAHINLKSRDNSISCISFERLKCGHSKGKFSNTANRNAVHSSYLP